MDLAGGQRHIPGGCPGDAGLLHGCSDSHDCRPRAWDWEVTFDPIRATVRLELLLYVACRGKTRKAKSEQRGADFCLQTFDVAPVAQFRCGGHRGGASGGDRRPESGLNRAFLR